MWQLLESQKKWWAGHRVGLPGIFGATFVHLTKFANCQIRRNDLINQPSKEWESSYSNYPLSNPSKTEMSLFYYSDKKVCRGKERESQQRLKRPPSRSLPTYLPTFLRPSDNPQPSDQPTTNKLTILWPTNNLEDHNLRPNNNPQANNPLTNPDP